MLSDFFIFLLDILGLRRAEDKGASHKKDVTFPATIDLSKKPKIKPAPIKAISKKSRSEEFLATLSLVKATDGDLVKISKDALEARINKNVVFLEEVALALFNRPELIHYYEEVVSLKDQSIANLEILRKIDISAIYYRNTVKMIIRHTKMVTRLRKF